MPEFTSQVPGSAPASENPSTGFESFAAGISEQMQEGATSVKESASEAIRGAGEQIRNTAQDAAQTLKDQGAGMAASQKSKAADQLGAFGAAIRSAADRLHNENDHRIAEYAEAAAERVDGAARYLKNHDVSGIIGDLESLARRQPELFLGGMFLAGMGLSRFLKASRPQYQPTSRTGNVPQSMGI